MKKREKLLARQRTGIRELEIPQEALEEDTVVKEDMVESLTKAWVRIANTKRRGKNLLEEIVNVNVIGIIMKSTSRTKEASMTPILEAITSLKSLVSRRNENQPKGKMMISNSLMNQHHQNKNTNPQLLLLLLLKFRKHLQSFFHHLHQSQDQSPNQLLQATSKVSHKEEVNQP